MRLLGSLTGAALVAVVGGAALVVPHWWEGRNAQPAHSVPVAWERPAVSAADLQARSGVKITQVAVTGHGGLVDVRYQVIDPDRANALHNAATPPALVDEKTGLVVSQLFMDHSHEGPYHAGVTYYLVFINPGNWVEHGSRVTVLLGNAQVEHVVVH